MVEIYRARCEECEEILGRCREKEGRLRLVDDEQPQTAISAL